MIARLGVSAIVLIGLAGCGGTGAGADGPRPRAEPSPGPGYCDRVLTRSGLRHDSASEWSVTQTGPDAEGETVCSFERRDAAGSLSPASPGRATPVTQASLEVRVGGAVTRHYEQAVAQAESDLAGIPATKLEGGWSAGVDYLAHRPSPVHASRTTMLREIAVVRWSDAIARMHVSEGYYPETEDAARVARAQASVRALLAATGRCLARLRCA